MSYIYPLLCLLMPARNLLMSHNFFFLANPLLFIFLSLTSEITTNKPHHNQVTFHGEQRLIILLLTYYSTAWNQGQFI